MNFRRRSWGAGLAAMAATATAAVAVITTAALPGTSSPPAAAAQPASTRSAAVSGESGTLLRPERPDAATVPAPGPESTAAPAPVADPCALLGAARTAAVRARATAAAAKGAAALDQARAQGCSNRAPGKQIHTDAGMDALARSLGVTAADLDRAMNAVKRSGTTNQDTQAAVFARVLGIGDAPARAALRQLMATAHPGPDARTLASRLGIPVDRAQWALGRIRELSDQPGGVRAADPDFAALARQLAVTPARLLSAFRAAERAANDTAAATSAAVPVTVQSPTPPLAPSRTPAG